MSALLSICPDCGCNLRAGEKITVGDLCLDPAGTVSWRGEKLSVTPKERAVLGALLAAYPRTLSRSTIIANICSDGFEKLADVYISHLRRALADLGAPPSLIKTEWGFGYRVVTA